MITLFCKTIAPDVMISNETLSAKKKYLMALDVLKPFCKKSIPFAFYQASFTLFALATLVLLSFYLYEYNPLLSVLIAPLITMFLCRSYVIEHDCGHQSFFRKKTANAVVGNIFGFLTMIPYEMWRYIHDCHHNNVGNLDKRDLNPELWTMTVAEYASSSKKKKMVYRMIRSKASRLIFAPLVIFAIIFHEDNLIRIGQCGQRLSQLRGQFAQALRAVIHRNHDRKGNHPVDTPNQEQIDVNTTEDYGVMSIRVGRMPVFAASIMRAPPGARST